MARPRLVAAKPDDEAAGGEILDASTPLSFGVLDRQLPRSPGEMCRSCGLAGQGDAAKYPPAAGRHRASGIGSASWRARRRGSRPVRVICMVWSGAGCASSLRSWTPTPPAGGEGVQDLATGAPPHPPPQRKSTKPGGQLTPRRRRERDPPASRRESESRV